MVIVKNMILNGILLLTEKNVHFVKQNQLATGNLLNAKKFQDLINVLALLKKREEECRKTGSGVITGILEAIWIIEDYIERN